MLDSPSASVPLFSLAEDQITVRDMARAFAAKVFAPHAVAWDEAKHFPVDEMRQAAELGMGGVYVADGRGRLGAVTARRGARSSRRWPPAALPWRPICRSTTWPPG